MHGVGAVFHTSHKKAGLRDYILSPHWHMQYAIIQSFAVFTNTFPKIEKDVIVDILI